MTGILVDTSVISLFAPDRPALGSDFEQWAQITGKDWYLPAIAFAELLAGIYKLRRAGSVWKADRLQHWVHQLEVRFGSRTLSLDMDVARETARYSDALFAIGRYPGLADVIIAATARVHGLAVLTCNTRHFEMTGLDLLHPETVAKQG